MLKPAAALFLCLALPVSAWACSCMPVDDSQIIKNSDAAFTGRVLSVRRTHTDINSGDVIARVRILKAYKGVRRGRIVTIKTGPNSAMCGLDMTRGERISVGASRERPGTFRTGICSTIRM